MDLSFSITRLTSKAKSVYCLGWLFDIHSLIPLSIGRTISRAKFTLGDRRLTLT